MYRFRSPSYDVARPGDRFWIRLLDTVNLTVIRRGTAYLTLEEPTNEELDSADAVWLGGYDNIVDDAEAASLTAAGYGAFLTPYVAPLPPPPPPAVPNGPAPSTDPTAPTDPPVEPPVEPPVVPPTPPVPTDPPTYGDGAYGAGPYGE